MLAMLESRFARLHEVCLQHRSEFSFRGVHNEDRPDRKLPIAIRDHRAATDAFSGNSAECRNIRIEDVGIEPLTAAAVGGLIAISRPACLILHGSGLRHYAP